MAASPKASVRRYGKPASSIPHSGQPLSGSLMDYGMPRFDNMPSFKTEIAEVLSPTNPFGIKAGGEGGTTPALSVIVNAVVDALSEYGVRDIRMPRRRYDLGRPSRTRSGAETQPERAAS